MALVIVVQIMADVVLVVVVIPLVELTVLLAVLRAMDVRAEFTLN